MYIVIYFKYTCIHTSKDLRIINVRTRLNLFTCVCVSVCVYSSGFNGAMDIRGLGPRSCGAPELIHFFYGHL